ncbi:MAG: hypothetical protein R2882_01265 [Gemmatimonadales bacterium]
MVLLIGTSTVTVAAANPSVSRTGWRKVTAMGSGGHAVEDEAAARIAQHGAGDPFDLDAGAAETAPAQGVGDTALDPAGLRGRRSGQRGQP